MPGGLIGRDAPLAKLGRAAARAAAGSGALVLVAGPAGVGKTALVDAALAGPGLTVLRAPSPPAGSPPYGPIVAALRAARRADPAALAVPDPLRPHLAMLLPELDVPPPAASDRGTLVEAIVVALVGLARMRPVALVLDDLQWGDAATVGLLPELADAAQGCPLLVVAAYRTDALPRRHPLRDARAAVRRAGGSLELSLDGLAAEETDALVRQVADGSVAPEVAAAVHARSGGMPFAVLALARRLADAPAEADAPLPETVREAVLAGLTTLGAPARTALEQAAVFGVRVDLALLAELVGEDAVLAALEEGPIDEVGAGEAAFRQGLTREALLGDVPWPRRRLLHGQAAAALAAAGAPPALVAEQWLLGGRPDAAAPALAAAAEASLAVHADRDAAIAAERALATPALDDGLRERLAELRARSADRLGEPVVAARHWETVAERREAAGDRLGAAQARLHLAGALELAADLRRSLRARLAAAEHLDAAGDVGEAVRQRVRVASLLQTGGLLAEALAVATRARADAEQAEDPLARVRSLGMEGVIRAKLGEHEAGLRLTRAALALALERDLHAAVPEAYGRLAIVLAHVTDFAGARDAYAEAYAFCGQRGLEGEAHVCLACLATVLRQTGRYDEALQACAAVPADAPYEAVLTAEANAAAVRILRGETRAGRPVMERFLAAAGDLPLTEIEAQWFLALADEADGSLDAAFARAEGIVGRLPEADDRHYVLPVLCWIASLASARGAPALVRACAAALAERAPQAGTEEALAALAHALGEVALADDQPAMAAAHFDAALERLAGLDLPWDRAHTGLRAGVAHGAAGDPEAARARLEPALGAARALGARPLAARVAVELHALSGTADPRGAAAERVGLTRRELQVLRLVAGGRSNREVAAQLVLSHRTIEMHVQNAIAKLGCRSRAEASVRAAGLGLLDAADAEGAIQ